MVLLITFGELVLKLIPSTLKPINRSTKVEKLKSLMVEIYS